MYVDDPGWRVYAGCLENLSPNVPAHVDVAGTAASIAVITPESFYTIYRVFYVPSNMTLVIVGNIELENVIDFVLLYVAVKTFCTRQPIG